MSKLKTISTLFSGGELFGVGAKQAGFRHLWGIEYDDKIASVARLNGFEVHTADVRGVDFSIMLHPDHLHASPPCPNFSVAKIGGREEPEDIEMALAVCHAIEIMKPETFTLENVTAYRKSQSLARIVSVLQNLGYMIDIQNLNAADFGVPQTRRRMILRASRLGLLRPYPQPVEWVGWYSAIEDILDTLPETEFAPWQLDRMPEKYKTFLLGQGSLSRPMGATEPAHTITANNNQIGTKAFLIPGGGGRNGGAKVRSTVTIRDGDGPVFTQTSTAAKRPIRAYTGGRVVKMTVQALGRFQTVPDDYRGLTVKINGNGVPCLMAREIMESMK